MKTIKKLAITIGAVYLCLLIFDEAFIRIYGQTPAQALTVVNYANITGTATLDGCDSSPNPCIDNRSQFIRQSSIVSYRAVGTGVWSVDMQWADTTPTAWTSFGSTGQVSNVSPASGIGYGIGPAVVAKPYHDFIRFVITGNATILSYSGTRQFWWLPSVASIAFPITANQGGTFGLFYPDSLQGTLALGCSTANSSSQIFYVSQSWTGLTNQTLTCVTQLLSNAVIKPASGQTVTFASCPIAGLYQVFDISAGGTIALPATCTAQAAWWASTAAGLNAAAASGAGVVQLIPGAAYTTASTVTFGTEGHPILVQFQGATISPSVSSGDGVAFGPLTQVSAIGATINCTSTATNCVNYKGWTISQVFGGGIDGLNITSATATNCLNISDNVEAAQFSRMRVICTASGSKGLNAISANGAIDDIKMDSDTFQGTNYAVYLQESMAGGFIEEWTFISPILRNSNSGHPAVDLLGIASTKAIESIHFINADASFANGGSAISGGGTMGTMFNLVQVFNFELSEGECSYNFVCVAADAGSCKIIITASLFGTTTPVADSTVAGCPTTIISSESQELKLGNAATATFGFTTANGVQSTINDGNLNPAHPCFGATNLMSSATVPYFIINCPGNTMNAPITLGINGIGTHISLAFDGSLTLGIGSKPINISGAIQSVGTKFTASGCTSITSTHGGATAGDFVIGAASCTVTITLNGATGMTATTGWTCSANDITTPAAIIVQNGESATQCTLSVPAGAMANDKITFQATAY